MTINLGFDTPALLWLLPLALLLPLFRTPGTPLVNGWLALAPRDAASRVIDVLLRSAAALTLAALLLAAAGPYRPEYTVERIGRGAEIVLVLDRSRSMDQGFAPTRVPKAPPSGRLTPEMLEQAFSQAPARLRDPKGRVARQMLAEFVRQRPQDRFALVVFSTLPMRVLDFTAQPQMIQAAIDAGNIGRGLSETNIGLAIDAGLALFEGRPYNGSRILMLVSDGGDRLDADTREQLAQQARKQRVAIDWLYLRSANSPLLDEADGAAADSVPELSLHRFFASLDTPYRAYEAGDPQALQRAIDDVNRQEKLPITYHDLVPQRELTPPLLAFALAGVLLLGAARLAELRRWAAA